MFDASSTVKCNFCRKIHLEQKNTSFSVRHCFFYQMLFTSYRPYLELQLVQQELALVCQPTRTL